MRLLIAAMLSATAFAQPRETTEWAVALSSRFSLLHDPVVTAYGFARLGAVVCAKDTGAGAELLRQSLARLNFLTLDAFTWSGHVLPVSSFTGLYKLSIGAARKCDPAIESSLDSAAARAKMDEERRLANTRLSQARNYIKDNPDRAGQLVDAAITSSVPGVLDMSLLVRVLSELRDRAPDLTTDLFPEAVDFVTTAPSPDPSLLMELGKYLFTSPQHVNSDDKEALSETTQVGDSSIANFRATRNSTDPDDVRYFIEATIQVVGATNDPNYDPVAAYALASQMLAKAQDVAPDLADALQNVVNQLAAQAGASAARVQAAVGGTGSADPEGGEGPRRRDRLVGQVLSETGGGHFTEARLLLKNVDDASVRSQVSRIVDFAEAAAAAGKHDLQTPTALMAGLQPGIKRCLIDCGMQAAGTKEAALAGFQFAAKETEGLPAEQRAFLWGAIASSILKQDTETFFFALNQMVAALNDAYRRPHLGRFDPKSVRRTFNSRTDTSTDSALVLFNRRGLVEAVDSGAGRHNFSLKVPGVNALRLADVLREAREPDRERIEAILQGLASESDRVNGLVALAAGRLVE